MFQINVLLLRLQDEYPFGRPQAPSKAPEQDGLEAQQVRRQVQRRQDQGPLERRRHKLLRKVHWNHPVETRVCPHY